MHNHGKNLVILSFALCLLGAAGPGGQATEVTAQKLQIILAQKGRRGLKKSVGQTQSIDERVLTELITSRPPEALLEKERWRGDQNLESQFWRGYKKLLEGTCWYHVAATDCTIAYDLQGYSAGLECIIERCREEYMRKIYDEDGQFIDPALASVQTSIDLAMTRPHTKRANVIDALNELEAYRKKIECQNLTAPPAFYECLTRLDECLGAFIKTLKGDANTAAVAQYNTLMQLLRGQG